MIAKKHKHKWSIKQSGGISMGKIYPTFFKCEDCKIEMNSSEVFQLETLDHLKGFQKWFSVLAIIISIVSLIISAYK